MNPHKKILQKIGSLLLFSLVFNFFSVQAATTCSQVTEIPPTECKTLVALYTNTNGPNWSDSPENHWNVTNTPCSWKEINCSGGHVIRIDRGDTDLVGTLPNLSALTQLQALNLWGNQLSGSIPDVSTLTQLQVLNLSINQLSGSIPNVSTLTQLEVLNLSSNQLSGSIPNLSVLTQLHDLDLSYNQLSGSIPDLSALTQLKYLLLQGNQLSGSIPDLSALTQLEQLFLYKNQLSGSIPDLSALTQLQELSLHNNQLSGSIHNVTTLPRLTILLLQDNHFCGEIPPSLANLHILSLYNNLLTTSGFPPQNNDLTTSDLLQYKGRVLSYDSPFMVFFHKFFHKIKSAWTNSNPSSCDTTPSS